MKEKHIKCVNFDLSTEKLLKHFPNGTAKPYELLKQFFLNYTEHKSVFYADARKRIEDKIISLCVDLNTSGEIINPKDFYHNIFSHWQIYFLCPLS